MICNIIDVENSTSSCSSWCRDRTHQTHCKSHISKTGSAGLPGRDPPPSPVYKKKLIMLLQAKKTKDMMWWRRERLVMLLYLCNVGKYFFPYITYFYFFHHINLYTPKSWYASFTVHSSIDSSAMSERYCFEKYTMHYWQDIFFIFVPYIII